VIHRGAASCEAAPGWRSSYRIRTGRLRTGPRAGSLRHNAGVTLMELLIAISLVSFISLTMVMALRVGLSAMERTNSRFIANRTAISVQRLLQSQIAGLIPVTAECRPGGAAPAGRFAMFEGRPDSMRFVSSYSLAEAGRGFPRLLEFQVIPGEQNRGVRLVVNERIYGGPFMLGSLCGGFLPNEEGRPMPRFPQIEIGPASFVLADKLAYCRILYRRPQPPPVFEEWVHVWPMPDILPTGIRIEMASLDPNPAGLQLLTITAPVHVTKWVLGPYAD
jgi:hypothetical protein